MSSNVISAARNLYNPVLQYKSNSKPIIPLCSAPADAMNHGNCTHSDEERCVVGTWVVGELCKVVEMGYVLVDVLGIWEYEVTCCDTKTNDAVRFAEYVYMLLKLKNKSFGYPSK